MTAAEFQDRVLGCRSCEGVKELFCQAIAGHGFDASACGHFSAARLGARVFFYFQDWPAEWIALYQRENLVANDYGVAEARLRFAPFTWTEARAARALNQGERRAWQFTLDFGWRDGLFVPIHGPMDYFGLVAVASRHETLVWTTGLRQQLHLLAFAAHERCRQLSGPKLVGFEGEVPAARELECLRWVAAGLSDPEIAGRMGISGNTVRGYVDAAREKLGARTRAQAITLALHAGLI